MYAGNALDSPERLSQISRVGGEKKTDLKIEDPQKKKLQTIEGKFSKIKTTYLLYAKGCFFLTGVSLKSA